MSDCSSAFNPAISIPFDVWRSVAIQNACDATPPWKGLPTVKDCTGWYLTKGLPVSLY